MSRAAKATFAASILITGSIVSYVHLSQQNEREQMKVGVKYDLERQEQKKQNMAMLKEQEKLTEAYRNLQEKENETT